MKLTPKEQLVCRLEALSGNPPSYEVVVIPGSYPPDWAPNDRYTIEDVWGGIITTQIRITVGEEYIKTCRAEASARDKIR